MCVFKNNLANEHKILVVFFRDENVSWCMVARARAGRTACLVFSARISEQAPNTTNSAFSALQGLPTQERQLNGSGNFCQLPENQELSIQGHALSWTQLTTSPVLCTARKNVKAKATEGLLQTRVTRAGVRGGPACQGSAGAPGNSWEAQGPQPQAHLHQLGKAW